MRSTPSRAVRICAGVAVNRQPTAIDLVVDQAADIPLLVGIGFDRRAVPGALDGLAERRVLLERTRFDHDGRGIGQLQQLLDSRTDVLAAGVDHMARRPPNSGMVPASSTSRPGSRATSSPSRRTSWNGSAGIVDKVLHQARDPFAHEAAVGPEHQKGRKSGTSRAEKRSASWLLIATMRQGAAGASWPRSAG